MSKAGALRAAHKGAQSPSTHSAQQQQAEQLSEPRFKVYSPSRNVKYKPKWLSFILFHRILGSPRGNMVSSRVCSQTAVCVCTRVCIGHIRSEVATGRYRSQDTEQGSHTQRRSRTAQGEQHRKQPGQSQQEQPWPGGC